MNALEPRSAQQAEAAFPFDLGEATFREAAALDVAFEVLPKPPPELQHEPEPLAGIDVARTRRPPILEALRFDRLQRFAQKRLVEQLARPLAATNVVSKIVHRASHKEDSS